MKRFIDMEHSHCLPVCFCFYQLGLCSVSYTAIYHFCIIIKDFFVSFSRVIIVQDFETVTFYVLFVYKPTFSVKPGFHYTANATTTTQKQSDYKVEQLSLRLIALF